MKSLEMMIAEAGKNTEAVIAIFSQQQWEFRLYESFIGKSGKRIEQAYFKAGKYEISISSNEAGYRLQLEAIGIEILPQSALLNASHPAKPISLSEIEAGSVFSWSELFAG